MASKKINEKIGKILLDMIDKTNLLPWEQPWETIGIDQDISGNTGKPYSGINTLLLSMSRLENNFSSKIWLTYKQVEAIAKAKQHADKDIGVRRGERGTYLIWCGFSKEKQTDEEIRQGKKARFYWVFRTYSVFNLDQIKNVPMNKVVNGRTLAEWNDCHLAMPYNHDPIQQAQELLDNYTHDQQMQVKIGRAHV